MGQKPSQLTSKATHSLPLQWILRNQKTTLNPNPEQPIKFQYKTKRKVHEKDKTKRSSFNDNYLIKQQTNNAQLTCNNNNNNNNNNTTINVCSLNNLNKNKRNILNNIKINNCQEIKCKIIKTQNNKPLRTKSEPNLIIVDKKERYKHRRKSTRLKYEKSDEDEYMVQQFGYEIQNIDDFLTNATMDKPANIPVVLASPSVLYQTRTGGYQAEINLPLGMVVNAVFKNENWLYVQTPHAEEGYVSYAACLPLGIIPPSDDTSSRCWEITTDVFPKPSGNMTDTEKLSTNSDCSISRCHSRISRNSTSICGEKSVDKLYLRATANNKTKITRQTLLVISSDYKSSCGNTIDVTKGDVVALLSTHLYGWFWVKNKNGVEGFIPSAVAGHGFL